VDETRAECSARRRNPGSTLTTAGYGAEPNFGVLSDSIAHSMHNDNGSTAPQRGGGVGAGKPGGAKQTGGGSVTLPTGGQRVGAHGRTGRWRAACARPRFHSTAPA